MANLGGKILRDTLRESIMLINELQDKVLRNVEALREERQAWEQERKALIRMNSILILGAYTEELRKQYLSGNFSALRDSGGLVANLDRELMK